MLRNIHCYYTADSTPNIDSRVDIINSATDRSLNSIHNCTNYELLIDRNLLKLQTLSEKMTFTTGNKFVEGEA